MPYVEKAPIEYHFVNSHIIVDSKIEGFKYKVRLVARGHMTNPLACESNLKGDSLDH